MDFPFGLVDVIEVSVIPLVDKNKTGSSKSPRVDSKPLSSPTHRAKKARWVGHPADVLSPKFAEEQKRILRSPPPN
jgi:hypothetical protein